jgi:6-phosphogluconolactonase
MNRKSFLTLVGATALLTTTAPLLAMDSQGDARRDTAGGSVYTMTNAPTGNEVVIFDRDGKGRLTFTGTVATGGAGSGGGLDPLASQGSLALTSNKDWLLAVNAASNDISVFRVTRDGLQLVDKIASGGVFPTSLAVFRDLVYVLNAGGTPNITGFILNQQGHLRPIASSTRALPGLLHSQVGFDPEGETLVVSDRTNNDLLVYPLGEDDTPAAAPVISPSHGAGPFSFVFSARGGLLVAEVGANAVSSYRIQDDGALKLLTPSVANGQSATCWIVNVESGYAFTANPGAHSLSSYRQPRRGELVLVAGAAGTGTSPIDLAATENGRFLYALDPGFGGVDAFQIGPDGSLTNLGPVAAGLPLFAQGIAVR